MSERLASLRLVACRVLLTYLLNVGVLEVPPAIAGDNNCRFAEPITLNAMSHRYRKPASPTDLLQLTIPANGVLMLQASAATTELTVPRLNFLGSSCTGGTGYTLIHKTPASLVLRTTAGIHFVEVSLENPDLPLYRYKLQALFIEEPTWPGRRIELNFQTPKNCKTYSPAQISPEPCDTSCFNELVQHKQWTKEVHPIDEDEVPGGSFTEPGVVLIESQDPLHATLYSGTKCGPDTRRAEGLLSQTPLAAAVRAGDFRLRLRSATTDYSLGLKFFPLCALNETDDHLDMPLCGTPLPFGAAAFGALDSATDDDYFTFELQAQATVSIDVDSEDPAAILLYDERGQRLEFRSCAGVCRMRVVRTLGPGRYDLRMASEGAWGGRYRVRVAVLDLLP